MTSKKPKSLQKFSRFPAFPNVVFLYESLKGMFFFPPEGVMFNAPETAKKTENEPKMEISFERQIIFWEFWC